MTPEQIRAALDSLTIPDDSCHRFNAPWRRVEWTGEDGSLEDDDGEAYIKACDDARRDAA